MHHSTTLLVRNHLYAQETFAAHYVTTLFEKKVLHEHIEPVWIERTMSCNTHARDAGHIMQPLSSSLWPFYTFFLQHLEEALSNNDTSLCMSSGTGTNCNMCLCPSSRQHDGDRHILLVSKKLHWARSHQTTPYPLP